ncbi:PAS domain S-box protein [Pseudophaeobacter sp.]|uniref:hybrid sensor histidine kinase/response regulator n=1 Tax=Pseudophaeobacter sp. TaxID=1971739 RepID=UPI0032975F6A
MKGRSEIELQQVFEQAGEAIYVIDAKTGFVDQVNEQAVLDLGYSREELYSMTAADLVGLDEGEVIFKSLLSMKMGEKRTRRGFHKRKDGSIFPVEVRVGKIEIGGAAKLLSLARDMTEQVQVLEQKAVSDANFRLLIDNSVQGVAIANSKRQIVYANAKFAETFGYANEQEILSAKGTPNFISEKDQALVNDIRKRVLSGESEPTTFEFDGIKRDGSVVNLECTLGRATWNNETATLTTFRDVTEEKQAKIRLQQAQKVEAIGQMTGGVAHDFNNLLAVILGNLELLNEDLADEAQKKLVGKCISATARGADLTRNMLAFAKQAQLQPVVLDANQTVMDVRSWAGRTLPASIKLECSLKNGLWSVKADKPSLESALLNLILNAKDAQPEGGEISVTTENVIIEGTDVGSNDLELPSGRYVKLSVSDTGNGIADQNLPSIFDPFFTTKPPGTGSGLGLSMVQGFIHQSGGAVQVFSEQGKGTQINLFFPAVSLEAKQPVSPTDDKVFTSGAAKSILVVEDQEEVRDVVVATLERAGYSITAAISGDAANALFGDGGGFDLLVTDIVMPGHLQGPTLAQALREKKPDLPVVFMSGYASETIDAEDGIHADDILLSKPVLRQDLLHAVDTALSKVR